VDEMKRALDRIQLVITDSSSLPGNDHQQQQQHSPTSLSVNAADSGISLSQLQTTAFRAIKDFEVLFLSTVHLDIDVNTHTHPFNGPFFWDYPGELVPERQNQSGFY